MRIHGVRKSSQAKSKPGDPIGKADPNHPNVANEVWSYGEETCAILSDQIRLRERLRPYIMQQMKVAQKSGLPPMRPLFVDFPKDPQAWKVEDQFLFGPDILVAPILEANQRSRSVYLPKGTEWRDVWSGQKHLGGCTLEKEAPLECIPVFLKSDSQIDRVINPKAK